MFQWCCRSSLQTDKAAELKQKKARRGNQPAPSQRMSKLAVPVTDAQLHTYMERYRGNLPSKQRLTHEFTIISNTQLLRERSAPAGRVGVPAISLGTTRVRERSFFRGPSLSEAKSPGISTKGEEPEDDGGDGPNEAESDGERASHNTESAQSDSDYSTDAPSTAAAAEGAIPEPH